MCDSVLTISATYRVRAFCFWQFGGWQTCPKLFVLFPLFVTAFYEIAYSASLYPTSDVRTEKHETRCLARRRFRQTRSFLCSNFLLHVQGAFMSAVMWKVVHFCSDFMTCTTLNNECCALRDMNLLWRNCIINASEHIIQTLHFCSWRRRFSCCLHLLVLQQNPSLIALFTRSHLRRRITHSTQRDDAIFSVINLWCFVMVYYESIFRFISERNISDRSRWNLSISLFLLNANDKIP